MQQNKMQEGCYYVLLVMTLPTLWSKSARLTPNKCETTFAIIATNLPLFSLSPTLFKLGLRSKTNHGQIHSNGCYEFDYTVVCCGLSGT